MKKIGWLFCYLLFILLLDGCLPAPRSGDGALTLQVSWESTRDSYSRTLEEIASIGAVLTRQSMVVNLELTMADGGASGEATGLYAGEWTVRVDARRSDGSIIYTGRTQAMVVSGQTSPVSLVLAPAPGGLDIAMDVTALLAQGAVFDQGKVAYAASGSLVYKAMPLADGYIRAVVDDLAPLTYDAKVVIPDAEASIFNSGYFEFEIEPGRTTIVRLAADGGVSVTVTIVSEPARVTGLYAIRTGDNVDLSWTAVDGATGYRVYRTDAEGRYKELAIIDGGAAVFYQDTTFAEAESYGGVVGYAVSALAGDREGFRSEPAIVPKT